MSDWSDGYVTDLEYTSGIYRELTPEHMHLVLSIAGLRSPGRSGLRYLELGAGKGLTSLMMAATAPDSDFIVTDFNPDHVLATVRMAGAAGLENIAVREESFEDTAETDLGPFDVIALHGVYSWISETNREAIRRIIRKSLRPGGLVYLSYNAMPGWAPMLPVRDLLYRFGSASPASSRTRLTHARGVMKQLVDRQAKYFERNPAAKNLFANILRRDEKYLVHEYFNQNWQAFWFDQVESDMAEAKLGFATSANLVDSLDELNYSDEVKADLAHADSETHRQILRDTHLNTIFRRDFFMRGRPQLRKPEREQVLENLAFVGTVDPKDLKDTVEVPRGKTPLKKELFEPLLSVLSGGPMSFKEIAAANVLSAHAEMRIYRALITLVATGFAAPAREGRAGEAAERNTARLNDMLAQDACEGLDSRYLASPVTGFGHGVRPMHQLFLRAERLGEDPVRFALRCQANLGQVLAKNGKAVPPGEREAEMRARYQEYRSDVVPVLRRLGIGGEASLASA